MKSQIDSRFRVLLIFFSCLSLLMVLRICMLMMDESAIQMKLETEEDYEYMIRLWKISFNHKRYLIPAMIRFMIITF